MDIWRFFTGHTAVDNKSVLKSGSLNIFVPVGPPLRLTTMALGSITKLGTQPLLYFVKCSGKSYKHFTVVNYDFRVAM